jgi:hypothetical protein
MSEDLSRMLARLIESSEIESASVTVVLKSKAPPSPDTEPVCTFRIGPVSPKE